MFFIYFSLAIIVSFVFPVAAQGEERVRVQLTSFQQTTISSEISAKISSLPMREGASFKTDDILVNFDCSLLTSQRDKAVATAKSAQETYTVNKRLEELGSIGKLELDQSVAKYNETKAELETMSTYVSKCTVRAPFTGRVAKLYTESHQYMTPGKQIMDIVDTEQIEVRLIVPSRWLKWLKIGSTFTVLIEEIGRTYKATVIRINPRVDALSQTVTLTGKIDGDRPELLPGMSGWAGFGKK